MEESVDDRDEELDSIRAIYPEIQIDQAKPYQGRIAIDVAPSEGVDVEFSGEDPFFPPDHSIVKLVHLPSLQVEFALPDGYPFDKPPSFTLSSKPAWVPSATLDRLTGEGEKLWSEYGQSQILFVYLDFLQQEAESAFDLRTLDGPLRLRAGFRNDLIDHDKATQRRKFEESSYDCGICLDPKKGHACYQLRRCGHVFCIACLQDFYGTAIMEGDVDHVTCLDPDCGKKNSKRFTLHPTELLDIPLERHQVQRYVDMKLKKMVEADKTTIYCPRRWCQAPARSKKYAKYLENKGDLELFPEDSEEPLQDIEEDENEKLAICSKCAYAFCRKCGRTWHGANAICKINVDMIAELTEDEKASLNYIRAHTSPCPSCDTPVVKTRGCNHMQCGTCQTHFCYLCSAWLPEDHPYKHFNTRGTPCYQKLWLLEEGEEDDTDFRVDVFGEHGLRGAELAALALEDGHPEPQGNVAQNRDIQAPGPPRGAVEQQAPQLEINQAGLRRFIEMAANDEEDDWDSDELEEEMGGLNLANMD